MDIVNIVVLALSGLLLLFVGASRALSPAKTYANNSGIDTRGDTNLLNELRGTGMVQFFAGALLAAGIVIPSLTYTSFVIGLLVFGGFLTGRLISMSADGKPGKQIAQGIYFEIVLAAANAFCLFNISPAV